MNRSRGGTSQDQAAKTIIAFADHLADEIHPCMAAIMLGFNPGYGWHLLAKVRKQLGWQAV